jgi:iron complex transport system permease protein
VSLIAEPLVAPTTQRCTAHADGRAAPRAGGLAWRATLLLAFAGALALVMLWSIASGSKPIPFHVAWDGIFHFDRADPDHLIIRSLRVPRTIIGGLVGVGLGLAGTLIQGLTRNPLADPGILGVEAGASLFVVIGIHSFGIASLTGYVWFAFAGAAVSSVVVYVLGSMGRDGATPVKLALAGAAMTAFVASITSAILLLDVSTLDEFRFWVVGSLANRDGTIARQVAPFIGVGAVLALFSGRTLNAMALGDDVARSLGQRVGLSRALVGVTIVLLVGGATAAAGPIAFVGLAVPHVARAIVGPDYRWILAYSAVLAPIMLISADVIGRVIDRPGEIQVGVITAVLGAPFFVLLVRYRKLSQL